MIFGLKKKERENTFYEKNQRDIIKAFFQRGKNIIFEENIFTYSFRILIKKENIFVNTSFFNIFLEKKKTFFFFKVLLEKMRKHLKMKYFLRIEV